jgi:hypothetical protein
MQVKDPLTSTMRETTGSVLIFLGGLVLIGSAGAKFAHVPKVVTELGAFGFEGNRLMFIAALEVVSAVLFLVPRTRSFGLLLVSSFMGGAIATHLQHSQPFLQPSVVLFLLWLGVWLRHPEILWSFRNPADGSSPLAHQEHRERALGQI